MDNISINSINLSQLSHDIFLKNESDYKSSESNPIAIPMCKEEENKEGIEI